MFLLNRFPNVSSSIPLPLPNNTPSRPISRPRTAPEIATKRELSSKSITVFPTVDENTEINVTQPTKVDLQRDVQILTLPDNENENHQLEHTEHDQIPF